jgi:hypothetical protein
MKITIIKTHQSNGEWAHAGTNTETDESRAKELIRNGLAVETIEATEAKKAPEPSNKAAPTPKNK